MSVPFRFSDPYEFKSDYLVDINDGKRTWTLMSDMEAELPKIYNMELREDDVWLLGYPKSGNTWASEMIYTVFYGGTKKANERGHYERWCFPEMTAYLKMGVKKLPVEQAKTIEMKDYFQKTVEWPSLRFLRSHLPFSLLPPRLLDTCKVVYICRNLKDCAISMFKMVEDTPVIDVAGAANFIEYFMSCKGMANPSCEYIKEAWERRHHPNMFFLFYEDMKKDLPGVMHKMAAFLGKSLTEEQVKELESHLSVENMRENQNINMSELRELGLLGENTHFIRKGIAGDWKNYFTPELEEKWNKWLCENMAGCDFTFPE